MMSGQEAPVMFRQLFSAIASAKGINESFDHFEEMLDHAHWMFRQAIAVLKNEAGVDEVKEALYERDIQINKLERQIRRELVRHLTVYPGKDVAACLTLMSIAKDAERIGDYCKNVFEVGRFYHEPWGNTEFNEPLAEIQRRVDALFDATIRAFHASDEKRARELLDEVGDLKEQCGRIERTLLHESHKYGTSEAVAYSLMARHYKRVAAHLGNICTAVTGEVAQLGYLPYKRGGKRHEVESD